VSQIFPSALSFLLPPDPPADEVLVGGASGMPRETSTPESTVVIVISFGRGIGERLEFSIVQLSAMIVVSKFVNALGKADSVNIDLRLIMIMTSKERSCMAT
jgi:hypothetical protein